MEVKKNNFLENFSKEKKPLVFYLLGSLIVLLFSILGQTPMFFFLPNEINTYSNGLDVFSSLDKNLLLFLLLLPSAFSFLGIWFVVKKIHFRPLISIITSRKKIDFERFKFAFILWSLISMSIFSIEIFFNPIDYEWNFDFSKFLILFFISTAMIPIQSVVEELIFRGYLMQGFSFFFKNRLLPLLTTSVIFGLLHILNPEIQKLGYGLLIYYIGTGLFFGIVTLMDEGVELSSGFHVSNNLVASLLVTADWTAFETYSIFKFTGNPYFSKEVLLYVLVIYPLIIIFLSKKYKWARWKIKII
ncbi:MAG: lysostaphin resistance A-like protein [Flavobacteriaceae bacterium]